MTQSRAPLVSRHGTEVPRCIRLSNGMGCVCADGRAKIKAAEDKAGQDADSVVNMLDRPAGIDVDGDGDMGDEDQEGREYPIMMKMDTEGFSALSVQERDGYVLVGLSDCSIAIVDLTREVILYTYKGHEDLVRGAICLMEKGLLITAGWDHSVRVWLLQVIVTNRGVANTSIPTSNVCARARRHALSYRLVSQGHSRGRTARHDTQKEMPSDQTEQGIVGAESRPYAERFPPYEPVSLKNDKGLGRLKKKTEQDKEPHKDTVGCILSASSCFVRDSVRQSLAHLCNGWARLQAWRSRARVLLCRMGKS